MLYLMEAAPLNVLVLSVIRLRAKPVHYFLLHWSAVDPAKASGSEDERDAAFVTLLKKMFT
jgi:hypothetical protein